MKYIIPKSRNTGPLKLKLKPASPQEFIFWDIETTPVYKGGNEYHEFKMAVVKREVINPDGTHYNNHTRVFYDKSELQKYMYIASRHRNTNKWIAHNTGYDLQYADVFDHFTKNKYEIECYYSKGTTTFISLSKYPARIYFFDTMNFFPMALRKLGDLMQCKKIDIDFNNCTKEELEDYNIRDVDIMIKAMAKWKAWYTKICGMNIGYTRGGDALKTACVFMDKHRPFIHNNEERLEAEFDSYHGGRTECFRQGNLQGTNWYYLDVNSLYPYIMTKQLYAGNPRSDISQSKAIDTILDSNSITTLSYVKVNTDRPCAPLKNDYGLIFPIGKFNAWYTGNELKYIIENGLYDSIEKSYFYEREVSFKACIETLYQERLKAKKEGNLQDSMNIKLLMNSIYGKFGQLGEDLVYDGKIDMDLTGNVIMLDKEYRDKPTAVYFNRERYLATKNVLSKHTSPIISSEITANARLHMFNLFELAGFDNIAYTDTDSLMVTETGYNRLKHLLDQDKLGMLKLEGMTDDLIIHGPKHYVFDNKHTIRGIPKGEIPIEHNTYELTKFRTLTQSLRQGTKNLPSVYKHKVNIQSNNWKCESIDEFGYKPHKF